MPSNSSTNDPPDASQSENKSSGQPPVKWHKFFGRSVFAVVAAASIVTATVFSFASGSTGADPRNVLTFIAPAGVGGGWDGFAREQQQAMRTESIVRNPQVTNIPGAGGTIGLSEFVNLPPTGNTVLATGAAMVGGIITNDSPVTFEGTRPIARIAEDYSVFVVRADSEWDSVDDLAKAWSAKPSKVRFTGGSAGSIDHLLTAQFARTQDISPAEITYIPKSGGGEAIQTLLTNTGDVAVTGYNEVEDQVEAGRVKPLAISAPKRLDGIDVPTFTELGYEVNLVNWRGLLAHPGVSDEQFTMLKEIIKETIASKSWDEALKRNRWVDSYLDGEEFNQFIEDEEKRTASLVKELGL